MRREAGLTVQEFKADTFRVPDVTRYAARLAACLIVLIAALGCDPGFSRRYPIDDSAATSPLDDVLREFEAHHLGAEFFRIEPPKTWKDSFRDEGYRVLRWYDRDRYEKPPGAGWLHLVVILNVESSELELSSSGFGHLWETSELEELRGRLSRQLCAHGYRVKGECRD